MKYGITERVKTIDTKIKINDIIKHIVEKKAKAIKYFLEGEEFRQTVIFGAYLCGGYIAHSITDYSEEVILVDIQQHLKEFVFNKNVKFMEMNQFKLKMRTGEVNPDLVIDITGIGGISPDFLQKFNPKCLIVEDPKGCYDEYIYKADNTMERATVGEKIGILKTYRKSRISKTSGTMTLTIDTVMDSAREVLDLDGVLYVIPNLRYYEGIIFHEKNIHKFLDEVHMPALTISALEDVEEEANKILENNLSRIKSFVEKK
ncbi:SAM-dependent methyltransferase HcgC family protein [Methanotorris igneus]|uniref:DUF1188 domain-containing protein n=1 Tax=Methanotorris igneus (strain DSM 5666 / JCM 11834 / Kol 5) TaxID=880724 RepID=F6BF28_METIK|nr:SAM-dependent methyltransferase HcgC family protein [Methanotorris igneus]AEF96898.1 protein of unknown function DUF1188 [Methanotorris igneus Kol 5]